MNTTWRDFKQYLEENILETNSESEENNLLLKDEAKNKYSITDEGKFLGNLSNLIDSIDHAEDENYHPLPELTKKTKDLEGEEKEVSKSWAEIFPSRSKIFFGSTDSNEAIDTTTFAKLEAIYNDFIRPVKLAETFDKDELIKFVASSAINLTYDTIKNKGVDKLLERWLADYAKLGEHEKTGLKDVQNLASQLLGLIKEEEQHRQEKSVGNWLTNLPWKNIAWYGGGGLLILLVFGWIWNKRKTK